MPSALIESIKSSRDVARVIERIYGDPLTALGLLHPTAVWHPPEGKPLVTLEINEETPQSSIDFFVLNLARARADAIVTTGKILRSEPDLRLEIQGPGSVAEALEGWRAEALGKKESPIGLVLTSGRDLDLDHPFFATGKRLVFTSMESQKRLFESTRSRSIDVLGVEQPSLASAIDYLRRKFGAQTISNETGPSTSMALYEEKYAVDELLLSTLRSERLPESIRGGDFLRRSTITDHFHRPQPMFRERTEDGEWRFERWLRKN